MCSFIPPASVATSQNGATVESVHAVTPLLFARKRLWSRRTSDGLSFGSKPVLLRNIRPSHDPPPKQESDSVSTGSHQRHHPIETIPACRPSEFWKTHGVMRPQTMPSHGLIYGNEIRKAY